MSSQMLETPKLTCTHCKFWMVVSKAQDSNVHTSVAGALLLNHLLHRQNETHPDTNIDTFTLYMCRKKCRHHKECPPKSLRETLSVWWIWGHIDVWRLRLGCVPEVWPTLKLKHSFVRPALDQFGTLYPKSLGGEGELVLNHLSPSLRVVLFHYRRCAFKPGVWDTCRRAYKGKGNLNVVYSIFQKLEDSGDDDDDDDDEEDAEGDQQPQNELALVPVPSQPRNLTTDWHQLSQQAPVPELFQVRLQVNLGVSSIWEDIQNTPILLNCHMHLHDSALLVHFWFTFGALLVHFWYTFGSLLVHFWCIFGAFLVHFRCTFGALFSALLENIQVGFFV